MLFIKELLNSIINLIIPTIHCIEPFDLFIQNGYKWNEMLQKLQPQRYLGPISSIMEIQNGYQWDMKLIKENISQYQIGIRELNIEETKVQLEVQMKKKELYTPQELTTLVKLKEFLDIELMHRSWKNK